MFQFTKCNFLFPIYLHFCLLGFISILQSTCRDRNLVKVNIVEDCLHSVSAISIYHFIIILMEIFDRLTLFNSWIADYPQTTFSALCMNTLKIHWMSLNIFGEHGSWTYPFTTTSTWAAESSVYEAFRDHPESSTESVFTTKCSNYKLNWEKKRLSRLYNISYWDRKKPRWNKITTIVGGYVGRQLSSRDRCQLELWICENRATASCRQLYIRTREAY